jgi:CDP-paratose 2-epimerase
MIFPFKHICISGGAGFVGSNLAILFRLNFPECQVTVCDNLKRRGSELNLPRLRRAGVVFYHTDIRCPEDFQNIPPFDLFICCSAEASVQAGIKDDPTHVLNTNLMGTINCLELARRYGSAFVLLSTSRIYPIATINNLLFKESESRFEFLPQQNQPGVSDNGITESFSLEGSRSLYGASKLASEIILQD